MVIYRYVLYGAMKSGKSTLLKIVLNLCKQDEGHVYFYGKTGSIDQLDVLIGYMPQQLGLEEQLTVHETIMLFASLNGLNRRQCVDVHIYTFYKTFLRYVYIYAIE